MKTKAIRYLKAGVQIFVILMFILFATDPGLDQLVNRPTAISRVNVALHAFPDTLLQAADRAPIPAFTSTADAKAYVDARLADIGNQILKTNGPIPTDNIKREITNIYVAMRVNHAFMLDEQARIVGIANLYLDNLKPAATTQQQLENRMIGLVTSIFQSNAVIAAILTCLLLGLFYLGVEQIGLSGCVVLYRLLVRKWRDAMAGTAARWRAANEHADLVFKNQQEQ